jgi:hypothetical protein
MLAGGLDATYRQALATSHQEYVLVEVTDHDGNTLTLPDEFTADTGGLVFYDGEVSATLSSQITRNASLVVPEGLYPNDPTDLLAPSGNRLRIWRGVEFADGNFYRWQVFFGHIHDISSSPDGQTNVSAHDVCADIVDAAFIRPENSSVGNTVYQEFQRLVTDALGAEATFGSSDTFTLTVPQLTWESDRAGALDEMATSAGAYWYALADGSFVMRKYPWTVPNPSILTLSDGPDGLIQGTPARDHTDVYNSITVTGERADGTTPVYALAQDTNPASPTYIGGNFGLRHKTIHLQTPQTQGSAQSAANDLLRTYIALTEAWSWQQPVDAALELGDTVTLDARGETGIIQVVSAFSIPLNVDGYMTVSGRAQVIGVLEA